MFHCLGGEKKEQFPCLVGCYPARFQVSFIVGVEVLVNPAEGDGGVQPFHVCRHVGKPQRLEGFLECLGRFFRHLAADAGDLSASPAKRPAEITSASQAIREAEWKSPFLLSISFK